MTIFKNNPTSLHCLRALHYWIAFVLIVGIFIMEKEIWLPVYGYEGLYEVSESGRIKSFCRYKEGRMLRPGLSSNGYLTVVLVKDKIKLSTCTQIIVLQAFIEPKPAGKIGLHNDGNKLNNHYTNLRWGTYSENTLDQIKHGTFNYPGKTENRLAWQTK